MIHAFVSSRVILVSTVAQTLVSPGGQCGEAGCDLGSSSVTGLRPIPNDPRALEVCK